MTKMQTFAYLRNILTNQRKITRIPVEKKIEVTVRTKQNMHQIITWLVRGEENYNMAGKRRIGRLCVCLCGNYKERITTVQY